MTAPKEVYIDGVRYVPAKDAVINAAELELALVAEYTGWPAENGYADNLYVIVTNDASDFYDPPTIKKFVEGLAAQLTL